jgi:hypothetical protein
MCFNDFTVTVDGIHNTQYTIHNTQYTIHNTFSYEGFKNCVGNVTRL